MALTLFLPSFLLVLPSFTRFYRVFTGCYWVLLCFAKIYQVYSRFIWFSVDFEEFQWVSMAKYGSYLVLT